MELRSGDSGEVQVELVVNLVFTKIIPFEIILVYTHWYKL